MVPKQLENSMLIASTGKTLPRFYGQDATSRCVSPILSLTAIQDSR